MMHARRGISLLEVIVAAAMLAALLSISLPTLGALAQSRHAARQRAWAIETAANILQRLTLEEWDALGADTAERFELSADAEDTLPGADLDVHVVADETSPPGKRITVSLTWLDRRGLAVAPVRLSTWVYQKGRPAE